MTLKFPKFVKWLRDVKGWPTQHGVVDVRLDLYEFEDPRAQAAYEGWMAAHHNDYRPMTEQPKQTGLYEVVWEMQGLHNETLLVSAFVPFCTCHGWAKHQVDIWASHSKKSDSVLRKGIAWRHVDTQQSLGDDTSVWLMDTFKKAPENAA